MNTQKTRHQLYLPDDLSEALDMLASKPGASKTAIMTNALRAWLDAQSGVELEKRFAPKLDHLDRSSQRAEATLGMAVEVLDLFVLHHMLIFAHQPPFDDVTKRLGMKRYETFMAEVARRVASGHKARSTAPATGASEGSQAGE